MKAPGFTRPAVHALCFVLWALLLLLPSVTTFASVQAWDVSAATLLLACAWTWAALWGFAGRRWFFILSYPLALFGLLCLGAEFLRSVNLLELIMLSGTMEFHEAWAAVRPYAASIATAAALLLALAFAALKAAPEPAAAPAWWRRRGLAACALATCGLVFALAAPSALLRAWPLNLLGLGVAKASGRTDWLATALPYAALNPREATASWNARRLDAAPPTDETYVLVIGESVRADRLGACAGPHAMGPRDPSALVYCDVTSGSSSTHTSVPLLVSREMPGSATRVSRDATFLKAFEEAGFRTYWLSVQEASIAWPDAQRAAYYPSNRTDRETLVPPFLEALREPYPKKLIVVHAYNAHFNYCARYEKKQQLLPLDCSLLGDMPTRANRALWLASYDNAIHESMLFIDALTDALRSRGGDSFLLYTPDHGENLLDDERQLFQHALAFPTRWDTRVPAIAWASPAWREHNGTRWASLARAVPARLMHADIAPTLLGAAGITYAEPRAQATDLTHALPPPRVRWVQRRLGEAVDADKL
jgi:glucan phosphoethanolaminetransferase (alkaline phosphatase superfamily)